MTCAHHDMRVTAAATYGGPWFTLATSWAQPQGTQEMSSYVYQLMEPSGQPCEMGSLSFFVCKMGTHLRSIVSTQ